MTDPQSFYVRDGEDYVSTTLTRGPWAPDAQHGGPPTALLAGAMERALPDPGGFEVTRVTAELLRPVPIAPVTIFVQPVKLGKRVHRLESELRHGDDVVVRASAVRIRRSTMDLPDPLVEPHRPPPAPERFERFVFPFFMAEVGYHTAIDVRIARGTWAQGAAAAWLRPVVPLVAGVETSPLERVMIVADATNGVCPALNTGEFTFINPDITVALRRPAKGTWVGLDARSMAEPVGIGLAQSEIFDEAGEIGRCLQTLVVTPRS